MSINKMIEDAVEVSQHAQRNYDLSKTIPDNDLKTLIHAATNSPSKQNESHFELAVYTDIQKIRKVYDQTKLFMVRSKEENNDLSKLWSEQNGKTWQSEDRSIKNSQILANSLFVFIDYAGSAVGGTHQLAQRDPQNHPTRVKLYDEQRNYSVGIAVGELILSATLLGYKTGICSAFHPNKVKDIIGCEGKVKLLVGIGYANDGIDRRLHAETLNKDLPELFQNGSPNDPWRFPALTKNLKISLNDENI